MNKIGLNKKFRMGRNDYVRLMSLKHFHSLSCDLSRTTTMLMLIMTLMALTFNTTKSFAQDFGTTYETANNIDKLVGIDPSAECAADTYASDEPTDPNKQLCLYNVGTNSFLSIGGTYGTHAALDNTPHAIWLEKAEGYTDRFWVNNHVAGSKSGTHLGCANKNDYSQLYMDRSNSEVYDKSGATTFSFIQAPGYSDTNKVYYFVMNRLSRDGKEWYQFPVTAYPPQKDEPECNIYGIKPMEVTNPNFKNQVRQHHQAD